MAVWTSQSRPRAFADANSSSPSSHSPAPSHWTASVGAHSRLWEPSKSDAAARPGADQARAKGLPIEIGKASFGYNPRGQIIGDTEGFIKLIFRADNRQLLGASVVGDGACELIHLPAAVMHFEGTLDFFIDGVFNFPTLSDSFKYAAYDGLQRLQRRVSKAMESRSRSATPLLAGPLTTAPRRTD